MYLPFISLEIPPVWSTVGGNAQRTSWVPDQVSGSLHVEWYRSIDAFISPNTQVIVSNNLVYLSTARGLYAFHCDTGALAWRYDSELPLGNSPTIATVNGRSLAIVGGYDKKIHAFNALTGEEVWAFAGAGAGYDANPLVVNNTVYAGNRDGYFYALEAGTGELKWQYPPADQPGLGPLHLSPAFSNGTIYFASDYNYAYGLREDGSLKWKSAKLVGNGYTAYWPVVYTDPDNRREYVIFSGTIPYREFMRPGTRSFNNWDSYYMYDDAWYGLAGGTIAPTVTDPGITGQAWAAGKTVLDYRRVAEFYENRPDNDAHFHKPWRRVYTVLNAQDGREFTFDSDGDGYGEYYPVMPLTNPGNMYPPVVGSDKLLYTQNDYEGGGQTRIVGWKFGTKYFTLTAIQSAGDEPKALSAGGSLLYRTHKAVEIGDYINVNASWAREVVWRNLWEEAPGFDSSLYWPQRGGWTQVASYGGPNGSSPNGIYGYHGVQSPLVPYQGRLYSIAGNALLAFGTAPTRGRLADVSAVGAPASVRTFSEGELRERLDDEIEKMIAAGVLKPGQIDDSQFGSYYWALDNYFESPGETLYTLALAYPYVSEAVKPALKAYLQGTILPRYFDPVMVNRIGWKDGVQRDSQAYPPELVEDMAQLPDNNTWFYDASLSWNYRLGVNVNPISFYGLGMYVANVAPAEAERWYQLVKTKFTTGSCQWQDCVKVPFDPNTPTSRLVEKPYEANAYIAGYMGILQLQALAGKTNGNADDMNLRNRVSAELSWMKSQRLSTFSKDTPYLGFTIQRNMNLSRNFLWVTPEWGKEMGQALGGQVANAVAEYNSVGPYWFVTRYNAAYVESAMQNLYDVPALFQAQAWILGKPRSELVKYLDVPAFERGDLYYIQNLVALLMAP